MNGFRKLVFLAFLGITLAITAFAIWFFSSLPGEDRIAGAFPADSFEVFKNSQTLTLYVLDPDKKTSGAGSFQGYAVIRQTRIRDRNLQTFLRRSLIRSITRPHQPTAACFRPGHALRVSDGRRSLDLLISFECGRLVSHFAGATSRSAITRQAEPIFKRTLRDAHKDPAG